MNQAVTYYQEMKMDSALYFINWLKRANVKDPTIEHEETDERQNKRSVGGREGAEY